MTIELGDVVQLNSGGPLMTVSYVDAHGVACVWVVDGDPHKSTFSASCLTLREKHKG